MDESIFVSSIIDKLPPSWRDFKHTLKHGKDDLSLVQLSSHLRIEESLRTHDSDKGKGKEVGGPSVNMKEEDEAIAWWIDFSATTHVCKDRCWLKTYEPVEDRSVLYMGDDHFTHVHENGSVVMEFSLRKSITLFKVLYVSNFHKNLISGPVLNKCGYKQVYESDKYILSKCGVFVEFGYYINGHVYYKRMLEMSKDDLIHAIDENLEKCTTSPYTPQQNGVAERKNRALKEMVNSMLSYSGLSEGLWRKSMCLIGAVVRLSDLERKTLVEKGIDCIFVGYVEHSKAYRPKDIIPNSDESKREDHSDDVPNEIPKPRKDPRTYNEAMQSRDFAFWKEAIDDEIGSIMENNTWVISDLPPGCKPLGCKWIFKRRMKVDGTVDKFKARLKFLSSRFSMKDMGEADIILGIKIKHKNKRIVITQSHYIEKILKKFNHKDCSSVSTPMDPVEKLKLNTGKPVDQLEYSRAIGCLMYSMTSTRPDIADVVEAYSDASWLNNVEDSSSTSGWVFLLGGGAILWASKKQTCITGSTTESEFVALVPAGKEAEWLKNLIHDIPIWPKPIVPISIRCDSAPTMARAYSQIYNGKSRHLGVRHSMVRELIRNGVISIEFVLTQQNLADHLTKSLARDLVYKSVIGMGLKSIQIYYL
nr:zinc finger, CCHC-type [Tanacetum cinerariifolium]